MIFFRFRPLVPPVGAVRTENTFCRFQASGARTSQNPSHAHLWSRFWQLTGEHHARQACRARMWTKHACQAKYLQKPRRPRIPHKGSGREVRGSSTPAPTQKRTLAQLRQHRISISTAQHSTAQHSTAQDQHSTAQHSTAQHTLPPFSPFIGSSTSLSCIGARYAHGSTLR